MEVVDREAAAAAGKTRFYTGKPCRSGHDAERYVSSGACCTCTLEAAKTTADRIRGARRDHRARARAGGQ